MLYQHFPALGVAIPGQFGIEFGPDNVAVYAGGSVTFQCITDGVAGANIRWWEYVSSASGVLISDGSTLLPSHPNYARYELILSDSRTFNLKINNVSLTDAGYYQCQDSNAAPPSTVNFGAQLVVIGRQNWRVARGAALRRFGASVSLLQPARTSNCMM